MNTKVAYKNSMGVLLAFLLIFLTGFFISCDDTDDTVFNPEGVAVNNAVIRVADSIGQTRIIVYSNGKWDASIVDDVDWLTLSQASGTGRGEFFAHFQSNKDQMRRAAKIAVKGTTNIADTIYLQQNGIVPVVNLVDEVVTGIGNGGNVRTGLNVNIPSEYITITSMYVKQSDEPWIKDITIHEGSLDFVLGLNITGDMRLGQIKLSHTDAFGITTMDSITVKQTAASPGVLAELKDFSYVRNLTPGEIIENICFEGYVISDKGNPNMGLNTNSALNTLDKTENSITSYVQNTDGTMGFRIRAKTAGDNVFARNEKVRVWLKGATLVKESNPERYTIEGITADHLISKEDPVEVKPREKYINQLTDNDMYTYVKLRDVEFSIPVGTLSNIHETYITRADGFPTSIRDINGDAMYVITNVDVPYRRVLNVNLPKGSGTISGILVNEKLVRYGTNGDIGRYSLRHITRDDIQVAEDINSGFSKVLAEWSAFSLTLAPDIGSDIGAKLSHSSITNISASAGETTLGVIHPWVDFDGLDKNNLNGRVTQGSWGLNTYWWNAEENRGESWNVELSTASVSKQLSIQISGSVAIGGPRNWFLEYSVDGTTYKTVPNSDFNWQDMVNYNKTLYTQVPGHKVVNFNLPEEASGKSKLYIRIKVKDTVAGNDSYDTGYSIVGAQTGVRIGHLTIKTNK